MHDFTILVLQGAYASSAAATLDILSTAARLAPHHGVAPPTWRVCSVDGGMVALQNGVSVNTVRLPRRRGADSSVWVVPGLGLDKPSAMVQRFAMVDARAAIAAVRKHAQAGGTVAASCSAVFLLQAAGLLQGTRVTTTWWLAPELKRLEPGCHVDAQRMVCDHGAVITARRGLLRRPISCCTCCANCVHRRWWTPSRACCCWTGAKRRHRSSCPKRSPMAMT